MIKRAYILGVQDALRAAEVVKYANEEEAAADASMLGGELDKLPIDQSAMLGEQGVAPEATAQIATAVIQMAQEAGADAEKAKAKADIAAQAASELAKSGALKMAEAPKATGTGSAGSVAEGEEVAKKKDQNKELASAVPNTAERPSAHGAPGSQADKGKGEIGIEAGNPPSKAPVAKSTDQNKELATEVPNTAERPNAHGEAGHQGDKGKGEVGHEEKNSSILSRLARL